MGAADGVEVGDAAAADTGRTRPGDCVGDDG